MSERKIEFRCPCGFACDHFDQFADHCVTCELSKQLVAGISFGSGYAQALADVVAWFIDGAPVERDGFYFKHDGSYYWADTIKSGAVERYVNESKKNKRQ